MTDWARLLFSYNQYEVSAVPGASGVAIYALDDGLLHIDGPNQLIGFCGIHTGWIDARVRVARPPGEADAAGTRSVRSSVDGRHGGGSHRCRRSARADPGAGTCATVYTRRYAPSHGRWPPPPSHRQPLAALRRGSTVTDRTKPPPDSDDAYAAFVEEAWRRHMGLAIRLTHDRGQAEELLQDSLVKVYQRWRRLSRHDDLHVYLRRVLVNGQTSFWRRRRRESLVPQIPETACSSPADHDYTEADLVAAALWVLPPRQRAVVVLRHYEDLPEREVARILGCALGTVKSQHAKAIAKLRILLDGRGGS